MRKFFILVTALCLLSGIVMLTACEPNQHTKEDSAIQENGVDLIIDKDGNEVQKVNKNKNKRIDVDITVLDTTDYSLTLEYEIELFDDDDKGLLVIKIDDNEHTFEIDKQRGIIEIITPITELSKISAYFVLII